MIAAAFDVVVVGGGMVGGLFACALGGSGLKVAVLERQAPPMGHSDRVSAITPASRTMLEALGVWAGAAAQPYGNVRRMRVWDEAGRGTIEFRARDIGEPCLAYIVENDALVGALQTRLQQLTTVQLLSPVEVADVALADGGARVTLSDGRGLSARLLIGADGAESAVRQAAGIGLRRVDLKQKGIVASVVAERPHGDTAYQRFLSTGPLAFLPLAAPDHCSIVWSADDARATALCALDDAAFAVELARAIENQLGDVRHVGARAVFTLNLAHASSYIARGVALIGDAAHTVHPLAGQGVNLGFLDAAALAEVVTDAAAKGKDIGALHVLRRYERWRKGENLGMTAVTGGFKYLFGNDLPLLRDVRSAGLGLANAVTPVKNFLMRRACGIDGDLPKLARRTSDQNL